MQGNQETFVGDFWCCVLFGGLEDARKRARELPGIFGVVYYLVALNIFLHITTHNIMDNRIYYVYN